MSSTWTTQTTAGKAAARHRLPFAGAVPGGRQPSPVPPGRRRARRGGGRPRARPASWRAVPGAAAAASRTGTIADLKHVVILMQENRSFDHYYGTLRGVRGFADKQVLKYQNGTTIFEQPDKTRTDLGYLLPFHMDSTKVDAQNAGDLDHSWSGDHSARNGGLWNNWVAGQDRADDGLLHPQRPAVPVRAGRRVHHLRRLPPVDPRRRPARTGCTSGPARRTAGRRNPPDYTVEFAATSTTYPELLLKAGHLLAGVHQPRGR